MADITSSATRGLNRRALLRNGLLAGLGAAGITVASSRVAQADTESAISPDNFNVISLNVQPKWRWCAYCGALFWCPSGNQNQRCPSSFTNTHTAGSGTIYGVPNNNPDYTDVQDFWHWCNLCNVLFYNVTGSHCAGNGGSGPHSIGSTTGYQMMLYVWSGTNGSTVQNSWRWCNWCQTLFWPNSTTACPGNNASNHNPNSGGYYSIFTS
jgi:hypothetical protein